jgi:hypothetical protein
MHKEEQQVVFDLFLNRISEDEVLRRFRIDRSDGTRIALSIFWKRHIDSGTLTLWNAGWV